MHIGQTLHIAYLIISKDYVNSRNKNAQRTSSSTSFDYNAVKSCGAAAAEVATRFLSLFITARDAQFSRTQTIVQNAIDKREREGERERRNCKRSLLSARRSGERRRFIINSFLSIYRRKSINYLFRKKCLCLDSIIIFIKELAEFKSYEK